MKNNKIIQEWNPKSYIIDVRFYETNYYKQLSPFYLWGDVPMPYSGNSKVQSIAKMIDKLSIIRSDLKNGKNIIGFRRGFSSHTILNIEEAKRTLLYPSYKWVLDNKCQDIIVKLRGINESDNIIILDYPKNMQGLEFYTGEVSIGHLLMAYIRGLYPYEDVFEYKEVKEYYTNFKRINYYNTIIKRVPRKITSPSEQIYIQLKLPFL